VSITEGKVSIFVSHHAATHGAAAARIKEILESRAERVLVRLCEQFTPGDDWMNDIFTDLTHSQILLVLVPQTETPWIDREVQLFKRRCGTGRIVALKPPIFSIPKFTNKIQIVEASEENIHHSFLELLFHKPDLAGEALNRNIPERDLRRDAGEIANALVGIVNVESESFSESLVVETSTCNREAGWDNACVTAPRGCPNILNWTSRNFTWLQLRERAMSDRGKGTFWVKEMEDVMSDVLQNSTPRIMSSTFRGRGNASGRIFRPNLDRVDRVGDRPVRFYFGFPEVLVPELVRGPGDIGVVGSLLHLASRVRWEVLEPFLVKQCLTSHTLPSSDEERRELIGAVERSLRVIDEEAERHNIVTDGLRLFEGEHAGVIVSMFATRHRIKAAIADAIDKNQFEKLIQELSHALEFNTQVMQILTQKYIDLVKRDRAEVVRQLQEFALRNVKVQSATTPN
jgi:hypothetical protein